MSRTAAITNARKRVSISRFGEQWVVSEFDGDANAWRDGYARDWYAAQRAAAQMRIDLARAELGLTRTEVYDGGDWTDYLEA